MPANGFVGRALQVTDNSKLENWFCLCWKLWNWVCFSPSRLCTPVVLMSYREACSLSQSVNDYQAPFWQELLTLLRTETKIDKATKNFHRIFCDTNSWWNWLAWPLTFLFCWSLGRCPQWMKITKKSISKLKWFEFIRQNYKPAELKKKNVYFPMRYFWLFLNAAFPQINLLKIKKSLHQGHCIKMRSHIRGKGVMMMGQSHLFPGIKHNSESTTQCLKVSKMSHFHIFCRFCNWNIKNSTC